MGITTFRCPGCDELLEYVPRNDALLLLTSMAAGILLAFFLGYMGLAFVLVALGSTLLILFVLVGVIFHIRPPKAQQSLKHGDAGLRLTDRPRR
jgi:hypothetical protein